MMPAVASSFILSVNQGEDVEGSYDGGYESDQAEEGQGPTTAITTPRTMPHSANSGL